MRIWYAADEWVLHHVSQLQPSLSSWREHLEGAAIKGVYERAHRDVADRVWVVSEGDQRAMRRIAGFRHADLLPNGVDSTFFAPGPEVPEERTCAFWVRTFRRSSGSAVVSGRSCEQESPMPDLQ